MMIPSTVIICISQATQLKFIPLSTNATLLLTNSGMPSKEQWITKEILSTALNNLVNNVATGSCSSENR